MKHCTLILALLIGSFLTSNAQNGGQYPENNSVKLEYMGGGKVKVTNKQSCTSIIKLNDSKTEATLSVPGNSFVIYILPPELTSNIRIKAKNTSNCNCPDFGWVEVFLSSLPVTFTNFEIKKEGGANIGVNFEIQSPINVGRYEVWVSKDGLTWTKQTELNHIEGNTKYSTKLNLSSKNN